jgi:glucosamine-6-phosphate deaminase
MQNESLSKSSPAARELKVDGLPVRVYARKEDLMGEAADMAAEILRRAIAAQNRASAILATGNTQLDFLERLAAQPGLDWSRIALFHMDEYLGINAAHPSSFRTYMREKVEARVHPGAFHYIAGDALEPMQECLRYGRLLRQHPIDLCVLGVGDNGHLAFNDPAVADFDDPYPIKIVKLDEVSRFQQVKQGHFRSMDEVPQYALTLTIPTLCASRRMICMAAGRHKAAIVSRMLREPIGSVCPASVLRNMPHAVFLVDEESASLI